MGQIAIERYVPVLKGKRAEFAALGAMKSRDGLTPLMEAVPTTGETTVPVRMDEAWPKKRAYFLDLFYLDDEETSENGGDRVNACFGEVRRLRQCGIPVTGSARSPDYQTALSNVVSELQTGLALRLTNDDLDDEVQLSSIIDGITALFDLPPSDIDIILDTGSVATTPGATVAKIHRANMELLPRIEEWRSLTVLAGAFPTSLSPLIRDTWNRHPRNDWAGWRRLVNLKEKTARVPSYGDYAIAHPDLPPAGRATILAQLRYTAEQEFLIWKGHNVFEHEDGYGQFHSICQDMVSKPEYRGAHFSAGDQEIAEKAATEDAPGNAESWRRIGTSHHLEMVKSQLANLP